jgi:hypothetical protein
VAAKARIDEHRTFLSLDTTAKIHTHTGATVTVTDELDDGWIYAGRSTMYVVIAFGWLLMAGAGLFWQKNTASWLLVAGLFWEKSTAG